MKNAFKVMALLSLCSCAMETPRTVTVDGKEYKVPPGYKMTITTKTTNQVVAPVTPPPVFVSSHDSSLDDYDFSEIDEEIDNENNEIDDLSMPSSSAKDQYEGELTLGHTTVMQ